MKLKYSLVVMKISKRNCIP